MKIKTIQPMPFDFVEDYTPNSDIFQGDSPKLSVLKHIIFDHLSHNERLIFLLYTECSGNYSKILNFIKVDSKQNLYLYISSIKRKIKMLYNEHSNSN